MRYHAESPLSQDHELRRYAFPRRKLVPVTTPVYTPTDTEFGSRVEFANRDPDSVILVPVCFPSPVYVFPPRLPSPPPPPSPPPSPQEPFSSPSPNPACLLSSTFGDTRIVVPPHGPPPRISFTPHDRTPTPAVPRAQQPPLSTPSPHPPPVSPARVPEPASTPARQTTRALCRGEPETRCPSDMDTVCTVPHLLQAVARGPIR